MSGLEGAPGEASPPSVGSRAGPGKMRFRPEQLLLFGVKCFGSSPRKRYLADHAREKLSEYKFTEDARPVKTISAVRLDLLYQVRSAIFTTYHCIQGYCRKNRLRVKKKKE